MAKSKKLSGEMPTLTAKGDKIDKVFRSAVKRALLVHKNAGNTIAVWRDGKVVLLSCEEIRTS
jgi:hypothetical protein